MAGLAPIIIRIGGSDEFSRVFRPIMNQVQQAGQGMKNVGAAMTQNVTLPVIGAGLAIAKTAATFEAQMNKVEALTGASGKDLQALNDLAKQLGSTTKFSATQAAEAMTELGASGFSTNEILSATPGILNLASAGGIELGEAARIASNSMAAFGLKADQAQRISDLFATAANASSIGVYEIGETMKEAAPIAKAYGASIEDVATATAFLGNIGIKGSQAGTSLKNMFVRLASPASKEAAAALKELGITTADSKGNLKPFAENLSNIGTALQKLPKNKQIGMIKEIFGMESLAAAQAMADDLGNTNSQVMKLAKTMQNTQGSAKKMSDTMNKGAVGAFNEMTSAMEGLAIAIADSGLLKFVTDVMKDFAELFGKMAKTNPAVLKFLTIMAGVAAILGPVIVIVGSLITSIGAIGSAVAAIGGTVVIGPIVAIASAILAVAGAIVFAGNNMENKWGKAVMAVLTIMNPLYGIVTWIISRWDKLVPYFQLLGMALGKVFTGIKNSFFGDFINVIVEGLAYLGDKIAAFLDSAVFKGLKEVANFIFSDEELKSVGLNADGGLKDQNTARLGQVAAQNNKNQSSKDQFKMKIQAPPGTQIDVQRDKGNSGLDFSVGPLAAGAF